MNNALMYLGGLLVVVLATLFAVPAYVDWNGYRGVFEEEASRVLGRDVRVGGGVNLRILPTPYVRFEKVRLADTTGQTGEPFIRAENFTMRLAIAPLLRGELEANEIELNKPVLTLALDGQGGGNWSSMAVKSGSLPFVPQNVSLRSVKISDGAIGVYGPSAALVSRVEAINGELSADSLKGPFKFKGLATWSGQQHDVKFATTAPSDDGSLLVRATSRTEGSANTFSFDGKLEDISGKPKLAGDLSAKLVVPGATPGAQDPAAKVPSKESNKTNTPDEPLVMDFKSLVKADASGAEYTDIALSLDNAAEPQLLSGTAKSSWADPGRFDIALVSKSIDLDRLSGAGQGSATFENIKSLAFGLLKSVAGQGAAGARLEIEQVKIGGELTGGLKIDAERGAGLLKIKSMQLGVPGGALMHLAGDVKDEAESTSFSGTGFVHGASLARLLSFAEKSGASIDVKSDGPFNVGGKVSFNSTGFEFTDAFGEISGKPVSGAVSVSSGEKRKLSVTLEAASLNTNELFPTLAGSLERELRGAFGFEDKEASSKPKASTTSEAASDVMVRVIANELKHGADTFRNVDATLGFEGGNIRVPSANFTTHRGLAVLLEGGIKGASSEPSGQIAYEFTGPTPDALRDVVSVFGLNHLVAEDRLAALGSGKAAGVIRLGHRSKGTADVTIDGVAGASRISGSAEFDKGLSAWRTAPSRAQLTAKGANLPAFLSVFGVDQSKAFATASTGDIKIAITGLISKGAATVAEIRVDGTELSYAGETQWPDTSNMRADGSVTVKASELRHVLGLLGVESPAGMSGVSVDGQIAATRDQGAWTLFSDKLAVGRSILRGSANLSHDSAGKPKLVADIAANQLSVSSLLTGVTDQPSAANVAQVPTDDAPAEATAPKRVLWPDASFALDTFGSLEGDVRVAFGALTLGETMGLRNGALKIALAPGKVTLSEIKGKAAGGDFEGSVDLSKIQGGIGASARLKLDQMDLTQISPSAKGGASLELMADGRGLSPASLMASLSGKGSVSFKDATMRGPSTRTAADLVDAVIQNEVKNSAQEIAGAVESLLQSATVNVGTRDVPITIANGVAKAETQTFQNGQDKLTALAQTNLSTLALTSSWMISSMMPPLPALEEAVEDWTPPADKGPLPPIAVAYSGQLDRLTDLEPKIDASELQRELTVRLMERNVAQLERLRKLDEQRARREQERRRAIEAEKVAAAAAAAAARAAAREAAQAPPAPPVLPDTNANMSGGPASSTSPQPPSDQAQPRPWAANPQPIDPGNSGEPASGSSVSIEPKPTAVQNPEAVRGAAEAAPAVPANPSAADTNAAPQQGAVVTPEVPAIAKPVAPARPLAAKPKPAPKRSAADEISRALGGIP